jgi:hypothetical protein
MTTSRLKEPTCGGIPNLKLQSWGIVMHITRHVPSGLNFGVSPALVVCSFVLLLAQTGNAQNYNIDWYTVAGGGDTSTGGVYAVSGTIGQHDAGGPMTGGNYSLAGGFWALISAIQTPGLPPLVITHSGQNVIVSWPDTGSYTLQQNATLAVPTGWAASGYTITTANGTNSITITLPTGNLFFRLANR